MLYFFGLWLMAREKREKKLGVSLPSTLCRFLYLGSLSAATARWQGPREVLRLHIAAIAKTSLLQRRGIRPKTP